MLFFTSGETIREPGVVLETAGTRDQSSMLIYKENFSALNFLNDVLHAGVEGFALACDNVVLFSPIGRVMYLPALGSGAD